MKGTKKKTSREKERIVGEKEVDNFTNDETVAAPG